MLIIGLTGGIGSGKSAASEAFARLGVPVIDTDLIARELVAPGQPALAEISARFGPDCLSAEGELDRRRLRNLVFEDPQARKALEAILHPRIRQVVRDRLGAIDAPYCLVVIPLLVESGMYDLIDRVLVIDTPDTLQIARVMARDRVSEAEARAVLGAQAGREARLAVADDIIDNSGELTDLQTQVSALHERYQRLAA